MSNSETENGMDLTPKVVYQPVYKETQLVKFKKFVEMKYDIELKDYWELHKWSYTSYPEFWDCVWRFFDILYSSPYTQVFDKKNGFWNGKWFEGVRLNFAANILKLRDSQVALIGTDDEDNTQYVTYSELYNEVKVYVKALKDAGIQKGDVVACYSPNKIEPVFAFLATAAIGATWSGGLPLLGAKGILARFQQIKPKIIFTAGNFFVENKEIRMDLKVPEIVAGLPSLKKVVFIPSKTKGKTQDITRIPKCVYLSEFLVEARSALQSDSNDIEFEQVPFDYPLCISFTSGTTGPPKGLIHSVGMFLAALRDYGLHGDCTREDVLLNFSPVGWISWHMFVNALHLGLTVVMYEGEVFEHSQTRIFDLVDKFGITSLYIWSSTLENMERKGQIPSKKHSLKTLKQVSAIGSPLKPHSFSFLSEKVKPNIFCSPVYVTTEVFGMLNGADFNLPVYKGEIQTSGGLGMDIRVLDENDRPVIGKRGEVVLATPYPALNVCMLNDENHKMMEELYLSKYPGYWCASDDAWINPITKGIIVYGRSDETMNPKGERFNCSEIYFALEGFPGVTDCVCVSEFNSAMDERVVLFVKMNPGHSLTEEVKEEIMKTIEHHLSIEHVPSIIMEAPDIPYNLTGKKLNGLVKKLINKRLVKNSEIVVNPASVDFFQNSGLGRIFMLKNNSKNIFKKQAFI